MESDTALAARLARNLDGSFESLVLAHQDRVYSIALRFLGNVHDAEEAAQDAFVRAYRALEGYDPARIRALQLRPWLATIVLNLCRNRLSRRRPADAAAISLDLERNGVRLPEPAADNATSPVAVVDRRETAARWAALVGQLPPAYRAPIVLRHVDGLSYPDLAAVLGRPEGTVKAQVHRGLALLRTAWEAAEQRDREEMTA